MVLPKSSLPCIRAIAHLTSIVTILQHRAYFINVNLFFNASDYYEGGLLHGILTIFNAWPWIAE
jgi:hypothetical protein